MNSFIFQNSTKIYFGSDQLCNLGNELKKYGSRVLLTYGGGSIKKTGLYDAIVSEIKGAGLELYELSGIEPNPRVTSVNAGADICKRENIDVLLAVGGGSVLDATKFIGAAAYYDGDAWDILTYKTPITNCLPIVTILTLSATGSEMNTAGVISNLDTQDKIGYLHPSLLPKASFLDPANTYTVSAYQTACGAADIMSHIIEVYFNLENDLYMLDSVMEGLMKTVIKYAPIAIAEPDNYEARANLMWASTWAINGFVAGGKGHEWSCHPMEHQLSAYYDITHGLGLAILTPRWLEYTLDDTTVNKFHQFGCNVFGLDSSTAPREAAKRSIELLSDFFFNTLGLDSSLGKIDIDEKYFEVMAEKACDGDVIKGFKTLAPKDVENIFRMCL